MTIKPDDVFHEWTVIEKDNAKMPKYYYLCRCSCGFIKSVEASTLRAGLSKSCGCKKTELYKNTVQKKYGVDNVSQIQKIKDKKQKTLIEHYGDNAHDLINQKREASMIERYGVSHAMQNQEFRDKVQNTTNTRYTKEELTKLSRDGILKKHGVEYHWQVPDIKNKKDKTMLDRYGFTNAVYCRNDLIMLSTGETLSSYITKIGLPVTAWPYILYKRYGEQVTLDYLRSYNGKKCTYIETVFGQEMGVAHYDKTPPNTGLHFRPDFKIEGRDKCLYINVDGLFWHSEIKRTNNYHTHMRESFELNNLKLIQFYEDEILTKMPIVKSMVNYLLGNPALYTVFARKLQIHEITQKIANDFLESNHLMGKTSASKHYALFNKGECLAVMSVRMKNQQLEISRFCSRINYNIPGGFSKLLKHCVDEKKPSSVMSFVDLRYATGKSLLVCGFELQGITQGWCWTDGFCRFNRMRCRANMDDRGLSQEEHAKEIGWYKIFDAGQAKFIKIV
jgi:hypothetical protein